MAEEETPSSNGIVLLTNDDGVGSPGLEALTAAALSHPSLQGFRIVVAAPASNMSGTSAAIGTEKPHVTFERVRATIEGYAESGDDGSVERLRVYKMEAPPAVAVLAAYEGHFGGPLRFVASGINAGLNVGWGVLHSGTVGAALTAQNLGVPAVAVSCPPEADEEWLRHAALLGLSYTDHLMSVDPSEAVAANVNVPRAGVDEAALATLARATGLAEIAVGDEPGSAIQIRANTARLDDPGSDAALLIAGHATVTFLRGVGIAG